MITDDLLPAWERTQLLWPTETHGISFLPSFFSLSLCFPFLSSFISYPPSLPSCLLLPLNRCVRFCLHCWYQPQELEALSFLALVKCTPLVLAKEIQTISKCFLVQEHTAAISNSSSGELFHLFINQLLTGKATITVLKTPNHTLDKCQSNSLNIWNKINLKWFSYLPSFKSS